MEGAQDREIEGNIAKQVGKGGELRFQWIRHGETTFDGATDVFLGGTQGTSEQPSEGSPAEEAVVSEPIDEGHKLQIDGGSSQS